MNEQRLPEDMLASYAQCSQLGEGLLSNSLINLIDVLTKRRMITDAGYLVTKT